MNDILKELKKLGPDYSLLYIEDNDGLRGNVEHLLSKFFTNIYTAENGRIGFELFKEHHPDIIITDINMPEMNGLDMAQKINNLVSTSKIIIMSAHQDKEYFHQAINARVLKYLNKPVKADVLMQTLYDTISVIQQEEDNLLLQVQLQNIFNYQNNIIIMLKDNKPALVNHRFLDFFGVDSMDEFFGNGSVLNSLLLEHGDFLCTDEDKIWYMEACESEGKLFHTKMKNSDDEFRHLILKARKIPDKEDYFVLTFDDVTELNLMRLFDKNASENDEKLEDKKSVLKMMKVVQDNSSKVKMHNFYKGLTITNPAVLSHVTDDEVVVKTSHPQLKIVQLVKNTVLSSEVFPKPVLIKSIKSVDFDKQTITFSQMQFLDTSVTDREYIRLEPEESSAVTLFYQERKAMVESSIVDISVVSIKVKVSALPPGVESGTKMNISIVLPTVAKPLIINTKATVLRVDESPRSYYLVLLYELNEKSLNDLKTYLAKRQMALIREFKSLGT